MYRGLGVGSGRLLAFCLPQKMLAGPKAETLQLYSEFSITSRPFLSSHGVYCCTGGTVNLTMSTSCFHYLNSVRDQNHCCLEVLPPHSGPRWIYRDQVSQSKYESRSIDAKTSIIMLGTWKKRPDLIISILYFFSFC